MSGRKRKRGSGGFLQQKLRNSVQNFVESSPNKVQVNELVDYLSKDPNFSRVKRQILLNQAVQALEQLQQHNQGTMQREMLTIDSSEEEEGDLSVQLVESKDHNMLNASLTSSYMEQKEKEESMEVSVQSNGYPTTPHALDTPKEERRKKRAKTPSRKKVVGGDISPTEIPSIGFENLGGIDDVLQHVHELIERPMLWPEIYGELRVEPPKGVLLHGPPGCGKSYLANAIAGELGKKMAARGELLTYFRLSAPELVSNMSGESESNVRSLFESAKANCPCLIFIDEIDVICPKRESAGKEMERRIVAQLLTSFDSLFERKEGEPSNRIVVIGATNRADSLDTAIRRTGRFDREISLGVPSEINRARILQVQTKAMKLSGSFDFTAIARKTPGFVGADLNALATEAASIAVGRIISSLPKSECAPSFNPEMLSKIAILMEDFEKAIPKVQPSAKREGFATIPNVTWDEVGALEKVRKELNDHIVWPIKFPNQYRRVGLDSPAGVLLYGPPGCGKTLLAKAIASDCSASFISVKGPELLNKYVGESERAVRKVFERAKQSKPCIIFFDELDALCPRRDDDGNSATKRVVNQLLTEMDGVEIRKDIFIIAATNRPDMIDKAMLRPQRLDKLLYVPLPAKEDRGHILRVAARKTALDAGVNLDSIADRCERFSGADLSSLVREASIIALSRFMSTKGAEVSDSEELIAVTANDFEEALRKVVPSVSKEDELQYRSLESTLRS